MTCEKGPANVAATHRSVFLEGRTVVLPLAQPRWNAAHCSRSRRDFYQWVERRWPTWDGALRRNIAKSFSTMTRRALKLDTSDDVNEFWNEKRSSSSSWICSWGGGLHCQTDAFLGESRWHFLVEHWYLPLSLSTSEFALPNDWWSQP